MWKRSSIFDSIGLVPDFSPVETSWWLDWSALPDLFWARLQVAADGASIVLDLDGKYHYFPDRHAAHMWLNEDEYSLLAHLMDEVEFEPTPPMAESDQALVPLMVVRHRD